MTQPKVSAIWSTPFNRMGDRIRHSIDAAISDSPVDLLFRADDIGRPGKLYDHLMELFAAHNVPICLAVVPAWMTPASWEEITSSINRDSDLWCWHQHGWSHVNHEPKGKKQEFGPARSYEQIHQDLKAGRQRLEQVLGDHFYPAFTPPWNRCTPDTLAALESLGFAAISGFQGKVPALPENLSEYSVNVDLHTRKDRTADAGWDALFSDLRMAISNKWCGVMIHHEQMNDAAFEFLDLFLGIITAYPQIRLVHFEHLANREGGS